MKKIFLIIGMLACGYAYSQSISPEVIATSGDYFVGTSTTLSWTLGEPVTETFTGTNNILTQGFQQKFDISTIQEERENIYQINVYPNPTNDILNVIINLGIDNNYTAQLFDMQGKLLVSDSFTGNNENVSMAAFAAGNYLLRINNSKGETIKTFKIVRNY
ncbi:MAG: T9SS type A sorting domain-containing protein [Bacteroidales bacterium]|nr:T9SS type A sorting domain-containing protein [Bacteroidales bacterium]